METINYKLDRQCKRCGAQMVIIDGARGCPECGNFGFLKNRKMKKLNAKAKYSLRNKGKYKSLIAHEKIERMYKLDEAEILKPLEVGRVRTYNFPIKKKRQFPNLF
jgi:ribosomal protein L37E